MYKTYEHPADIGVYGEGHNIEEAFQEVAKAMFSVEVNIDKIESKKMISIEIDEDKKEDLLFAWLNELLAMSDINNMMFANFEVHIKKDDKYHLTAKCYGEKTNHEKMNFQVEVKAATYSQLEVIEKDNKVIAKCIVDV